MAGYLGQSITTKQKQKATLDKLGWVFMRGSGILLVVLIAGHIYFNLLTGSGIHQIDWGFVAGKLADPFWQAWDICLLWLALIHGSNGIRTIINDYIAKDAFKKFLVGCVVCLTIVLIVLGTWVVFGFDPCGDPTSSWLEYCQVNVH